MMRQFFLSLAVVAPRRTWPSLAVAVLIGLLIRQSMSPIASARAGKRTPVVIQTTHIVPISAEPPILIACSSTAEGHPPIWMVSDTHTPTVRDSTLVYYGALPAWSAKRTGVLTVTNEKRTLVYRAFDPATQTFGAARRVDRRFANAGVSYELSIHSAFAWSHDESKIVYAENQQLVSFDLHTGRKRMLTKMKDMDFDTPSWSPDGSTIAFSSYGSDPIDPSGEGDGEPLADIWLMHADDSKLRRLGHGSSLHWSKDGHTLLVALGNTSGASEIGEYDLTAHNRYRTIRRCKALFPDGKLYSSGGFDDAVYSPDGKSIAIFGAYDPKKDGEGVFIINRKGRFIRLLAKGNEFGPIMHPARLSW